MKTFVLLLAAGLLGLAAAPDAARAGAANRSAARPLPHGPQSRTAFLAAKTLPGGDKDGEQGDAAVTSDRYDMLRHTIDLRVDPSRKSVAGAVQMVFRSEVADLTEFVFDLNAALQITAIEHLSGPLTFAHGADTVLVTLPAALTSGEVDSLVVRYGGDRTSPVVNRGLMFKTHFPEPPIPQEYLVPLVANLSQPAYAQAWWPCKDRPDDKFLMTMNLTVPDTLVGVSNGTLMRDVVDEQGWRTFTWRENHPIASYLVSVAISDYVLLEDTCVTAAGTTVPLQNWVLPRDVANAAVDFAPVCAMMDFCESLYGAYPFEGEKYGHAVFIWPGAMEHQTVTSIGTTFLDGTGDHAWLVMHELAHQWFGDSMTPQKWADIWLNEGFATYAEALWFEATEGTAAYEAYMADARNLSEWVDQGPVYDPMPVFPGRVIYDKGAWILHMLRDRMGDAAFFAFVAEWTAGGDRPLGYVTTEDLIAVATSHAGEDLGGFLWPYLKTAQLPVVTLEWEAVPEGSGQRLDIKLAQLQTPLFDNTYTLRAQTARGAVDFRVNLAGQTVSESFAVADSVWNVELDPDDRLLWADGGSPGAVTGGLSFAFPNPSEGNYIVFRYHLAAPTRPILKVYDARGRLLAQRDLGPQESGLHDYGFDVTGDGGARLPSGVYWAALHVGGHRSVRKFAVVR